MRGLLGEPHSLLAQTRVTEPAVLAESIGFSIFLAPPRMTPNKSIYTCSARTASCRQSYVRLSLEWKSEQGGKMNRRIS
jgi:hypothetical protein